MMPGVPLLTIEQVRVRLGLESDDDSYDEKLVPALPLVTSWFEQYCQRGLARRTILEEEIFEPGTLRIHLWAFPIDSITKVDVDGTLLDISSLMVNRRAGYFYGKNGYGGLESAGVIKVDYVGGYATADVPDDLAQAYASCCGSRAGVPNVFGSGSSGSSAIKSIGLGGGALSVQFDTGAVAGGIIGAMDVSNVPVEVQNYASVLNYYRRICV